MRGENEAAKQKANPSRNKRALTAQKQPRKKKRESASNRIQSKGEVKGTGERERAPRQRRRKKISRKLSRRVVPGNAH